MIDLERARKAYREYAKNYDAKNGLIALKTAHMERVPKISKKIAEELNLDEEQVKLAELIGLLHDIGRFEQVKKYNTFVDARSRRHADIGVEILFDEGKIRDYIEDDQYDEIIKNAIYYHGRDNIGEGLDKACYLQCQIIRDADKLDIMHILLTDSPSVLFEDEEKAYKETIADEIVEEFMKEHRVDYSKATTETERVAQWLGYAFDINFKSTLQNIYDNQYMKKIVNRFVFSNQDTIEKLKKMEEETTKFMEEQLKK